MRPHAQPTGLATAARPTRRTGWRTAGMAAALAAYVLILAYLIGLAIALIRGTQTWPAALGYPQTLLTPSPWPAAVAALLFLLALTLSISVARHMSAYLQGGHEGHEGRQATRNHAQGITGPLNTAQSTVPPVAAAVPPSPPASPVPPASPPAPATEPGTDSSPPAGERSGEGAAPPSPGTFTPRVFISHSSADAEFGLRLERQLRDALGSADAVFYDRDGDAGLKGGDQWLKTLQHEIVTRNVFVVLLSPDAFASPWVDQELSLAFRRAVSDPEGTVLIPVLHRPTDLWPFLENFQYVSFLEPRPFDAAFAELLEAVALGRSRRSTHGALPRRQVAPFDGDLLPLPERFVGRADELEWTLARLAPETTAEAPAAERPEALGLASIAAANGLGGIGKSALAGQVVRILWAANRFPDGIAVILCQGLSDPAEVLRRVLARFDPDASRSPTSSDLRRARRRSQDPLHGQDALVVLDNVEPGCPPRGSSPRCAPPASPCC